MRKSIIAGAALLAAAFVIGYGVGQVSGALPGFAAVRSHLTQSANGNDARTAGQVTGITDSIITIVRPTGPWGARSGATTIATTSSTQYFSAPDQAAKRSDIQKGNFVFAVGTLSSDGKTLNASKVMIRSGNLPMHPLFGPRAGGMVKSVNGSSIDVTSFDGSKQTIEVSSSTKYVKEGASASLSDVTVGSRIHAEGTESNGVIHAMVVEIEVPRVAGKVTAVNNSTYTVSAFKAPWDSGAATTVDVVASSSTKYFQGREGSASASAIKPGTSIVAEGTLSNSGKTLHADRIMILPASLPGPPGSGLFGRHHFGQGHGTWGDGPVGPPDSGMAPGA